MSVSSSATRRRANRSPLRHRHAADGGDARGDGRGSGRRRPVRRGPVDQPASGTLRRLLGKEAALWLPTGTMANQVALKLLTRPGDDVIVSRQSHAVWHEAGASAANAGVQFTEIGERGVFTAEEVLAARKPRGHPLYAPTTLVEVENTHNRSGGVVVPQREAVAICAAARAHDIASYLDGSRLWNAAVASGTDVAELAAPFDVVSVAFSKGLGAPGGALLAGPAGSHLARRPGPPHARRRDAAGRLLRRRRALRARSPRRAPRRRSRQRRADRRPPHRPPRHRARSLVRSRPTSSSSR